MYQLNGLKSTLATKIATMLRIKIIKGVYAADAHLNEVRIAAEYGVSRGPIREALKILENEGFAYTPSNGRTVAVAFTQKDFSDYHELRYFLEANALTRIIQNADSDRHYTAWLDQVGRYVSEMEKSLAEFSEEEFNQNDFLFHKDIMRKSDNRIARNVWDSYSGIRDAIMVVNKHYLAGKHVADIIFEPHYGIFEGLKQRDIDKAIHSCRVHMDNSIKIYADAYK
jgi:GntR family transcriptional regulator of gluconate operon